MKPSEGHYTAMVRKESPRGDTWVCIDDERVKEISVSEVLAQQQYAYLLFYRLEVTAAEQGD